MHLVSCAPPPGPLDAAPRTALIPDDAAAWCETFWSADGAAYFVCCTMVDGTHRWLELRDDDDEVLDGDLTPARPRALVASASQARRTVLLLGRTRGPSGRARQMLIGSTRRRAR